MRIRRKGNGVRGAAGGREGAGTPKACAPPTASSLAGPDRPRETCPAASSGPAAKLSLLSPISQKFRKITRAGSSKAWTFSTETPRVWPCGGREPGARSHVRLPPLTVEELRAPWEAG